MSGLRQRGRCGRVGALLLLAVACLPLGGCALTPVYADGARGAAAQALAGVEVAPIPDRAGFLVRSALQDRMGRDGGPVRYRLEVALDDRIDGFGVRGDNSITRERRTLRARWQLVDAGTGKTVLDATAGSDAGIDVVSSDYAVVAAESTALERLAVEVADQIAARVALYARTTAAAAPAAAAAR